MSTAYYEQLALGWHPDGPSNKLFQIITVATLVAAIIFAFTMSSIDVPEPDRNARAAVPERIANFILEKKRKAENQTEN